MCGVEIWDTSGNRLKFLENFEVWYWRRMEKIICTDRVRNEEVLRIVKEEKEWHTNRKKTEG